MRSALARKLDELEPRVLAHSGQLESSVYGIVDRVDKVDGKLVPHFIRKWKGTIGNMTETEEDPTIWIIEKLEPLILKHKKVKGAFGGRGGAKSMMAMDVMVGEVNSNGSGVFCLRERMKSISQSIYKGINSRISALNFKGFNPVESKWKIDHSTGGIISFGGLANVEDMKSLFQYKYFLLEEAANTSQEALDTLGPTLRGVEGAEQWFIWNAKSSNDPMSKEFIVPFQDDYDRQGYYEDDHHLIIKVSYKDNPFFQHDSSLVEELEKDTQKVKRGLMSKSRYNHIWNGAFNDDIEDSLIDADWFDACVDAHEKLGFKASGAVTASHDPADVGSDEKTIAIRHGVVFTYMEEINAHTGNDAFDYACGTAKKYSSDVFVWDCDGMGALLRNQAADNFKGTKVKTSMFKGSESVHNPDAIFNNAEDYGIHQAKTNADVFRNKRAQNYVELAQRMQRTYDAVVNGTYHNPDNLISFSSNIECLSKLRSELCRLPLKPNMSGKIELYSKDDMRKGIMMKDGSRLRLPSPNLADDVMMSFDNGCIINNNVQAVIPKPIRPMGRR